MQSAEQHQTSMEVTSAHVLHRRLHCLPVSRGDVLSHKRHLYLWRRQGKDASDDVERRESVGHTGAEQRRASIIVTFASAFYPIDILAPSIPHVYVS